jgi:hypothetical protein
MLSWFSYQPRPRQSARRMAERGVPGRLAARAGIFLRPPFQGFSREFLPTFQRENLSNRTGSSNISWTATHKSVRRQIGFADFPASSESISDTKNALQLVGRRATTQKSTVLTWTPIGHSERRMPDVAPGMIPAGSPRQARDRLKAGALVTTERDWIS